MGNSDDGYRMRERIEELEIADGGALAERVKIVGEIRKMADETRRNAYTPATGVALGAIIDSVADRINTLD